MLSLNVQVWYDPAPLGVTLDEIADEASKIPKPLFLHGERLVIHIQTSEDAVDDLLSAIRNLAEQKKKEGFVAIDSNEETRMNGNHGSVYSQKSQGI